MRVAKPRPTSYWRWAVSFTPSWGWSPFIVRLTSYPNLDSLRKLHLEHGCHTYAVSPAGMQAAGDSPAAEQPAAEPDHHAHHIICQQCQRAVEFAGCDIAAVITEVEAQTGFRVRAHWLEMFGLCPECQGHVDERRDIAASS